jgi:DNA-binding beta-propeller fold protein YncE
VEIPCHSQTGRGDLGEFDHADVHRSSGRVFVAHTTTGNIEVIDGKRPIHIKTILGCPEASGVLCAQEQNLIFAAARGTGKVLVINPNSCTTIREIEVGTKPNGLAWDSHRKQLLVADVEDYKARLIDPSCGDILSTVRLLGRPRWCIYDESTDCFLVNIRDPACVAILTAKSTMLQTALLPVPSSGPHGLDIDEESGLVFVACDGGAVVKLNTKNAADDTRLVSIAGEPDVIWHNSSHHRLYCAIAKPGVIDVIDTKTMALTEEVHTEEGAHTLAFDNVRQRLYVFLPKSCRAAIYEEQIKSSSEVMPFSSKS